jgi:hypothetical protein
VQSSVHEPGGDAAKKIVEIERYNGVAAANTHVAALRAAGRQPRVDDSKR